MLAAILAAMTSSMGMMILGWWDLRRMIRRQPVNALWNSLAPATAPIPTGKAGRAGREGGVGGGRVARALADVFPLADGPGHCRRRGKPIGDRRDAGEVAGAGRGDCQPRCRARRDFGI